MAIKVSTARFSERFEREERVIASLNHPHICQLYDVGPNYLVMELVEGPTMADRIKRGALTLDEALAIAAIGSASSAALGVRASRYRPFDIAVRACSRLTSRAFADDQGDVVGLFVRTEFSSLVGNGFQ